MPSNLKYHKNYTELGDSYQLVLPLSLEGLVPEDESVRLLSHILEELDYTKLYQAYSTKGRNPAVNPKTMFKILTYAYSQNIYSSRKIERACRRDINFMWLLAGQKAPDHSTIARFRTGFLAEACEDLFYQLVRLLASMGELSKETVFIDGTKLEACANKYTFVWKKSVNKWEEKMFPKMETLVTFLNREYMKDFTITKENRTQELQQIFDFIDNYCKDKQIEFVHGRGKRRSVHQKFHEIFRRFLDRQLLYDLHNSRFLDRNSYSKTDVDATFMHMKDDHMRNAQLKPGYNVQIGVDSEYIVATDIFSDRNDVWTLVPFLQRMEEKLGFKYPTATADAGYESEEGYDYMKKNGQTPYIKPQTYEKWKKRSFKNDISKRENMKYDEETDTYICHNGKKLKPQYITKKTSKNGYESEVTMYECESCEGCPYKEKCTRAKRNKRMGVSKKFITLRQESYENITSELGIQYRMNRSIQVEGAFGVLKNDYEFQRFLLRGKTKVKLEILLLCFGYNINKLHAKIQNNRTKTHFFDVKTA
ncbi:MAG: IS1182 family transposase [Alphaproteobacteria bacterium]|nr:IS1182 family transposase [Alphaproteobacteria bacterium]MBQ4530262.1 IS1182 family transposase [Lachnospiraceae bacterium]MBQ6888260.1 IS1182 family transposase [Lachnospiraceae bacterium]